MVKATSTRAHIFCYIGRHDDSIPECISQERQREEIQKYLDDNSLTCQEFITETNDRHIVNELLEKMHTGDTLVIYSIYNIAHNMNDVVSLIHTLKNLQFRLYTVREQVENDAQGTLCLQLMCAMDELKVNIARGKLVDRPATLILPYTFQCETCGCKARYIANDKSYCGSHIKRVIIPVSGISS